MLPVNCRVVSTYQCPSISSSSSQNIMGYTSLPSQRAMHCPKTRTFCCILSLQVFCNRLFSRILAFTSTLCKSIYQNTFKSVFRSVTLLFCRGAVLNCSGLCSDVTPGFVLPKRKKRRWTPEGRVNILFVFIVCFV